MLAHEEGVNYFVVGAYKCLPCKGVTKLTMQHLDTAAFINASSLHVDSCNVPGSKNFAVGLGNYSGGELFVESEGGSFPFEDVNTGEWLRGDALALNLEPRCFDGLARHAYRAQYAAEPHAMCQCLCCGGQSLVHGGHIPVADEVKYLGVCLDAACSAQGTVSQRISKAVAASKQLKPLFGHSALPCKWKLIVYRSSVMSILAYGMESCNLPPSEQRRADSLHFKNLRRIFRKKSSYYHRVIAPSDAPCSNEYLTQLANRWLVLPTPSQQFSFDRLRLLGHILRHPDSFECTSTFMSSKAYRVVRGGNRSGRPTPHWAEVSMAEAYIRLQRQGDRPDITNIHHDYWKSLSARDIKEAHCSDKLPQYSFIPQNQPRSPRSMLMASSSYTTSEKNVSLKTAEV